MFNWEIWDYSKKEERIRYDKIFWYNSVMLIKASYIYNSQAGQCSNVYIGFKPNQFQRRF